MDIIENTLKIAEQDDTFKAIEFIESQGEPAVVAGSYANLISKVYRDKKDVPLMVMMGRAGINFALVQARGANDEEAAAKLKAMAKSMAYNLAANTWPGWNDPGIVISSSDQAAGLDAARLNLRLARELNGDAKVFGNA